MSGTVSGTASGPPGSDARKAIIEALIRKAIRDYPAHAGRPGWSYGLDNLDFRDFVPELAEFIAASLGAGQ